MGYSAVQIEYSELARYYMEIICRVLTTWVRVVVLIESMKQTFNIRPRQDGPHTKVIQSPALCLCDTQSIAKTTNTYET